MKAFDAPAGVLFGGLLSTSLDDPAVAVDDEKNGWSVLRADGSVRPCYEAVKQLPK